MDLTEKQLSRKAIWQGSFVDIYEDRVELPNGHEAGRVVITHPGAACVLAVTADKKVVLVRQWRYPIGGTLLEVPAGKLDVDGEDPAACALRELAEETPYTAESVELIATFYTAPGFCNEKMHVYLAKNIQKNSVLHNDEDEFTETVLMSADEVRAAVANDEISDAKTLVALQYWLLHGCA